MGTPRRCRFRSSWRQGIPLLVGLAAFVAGCRQPAPPAEPTLPRSSAAPLKDDLGRPWNGSLPARRVVSLAPNVTEIVCAIGGRSRLAGIDTASDYPPDVRRIPRVGDFLTPNVERLVALRPDAILLSSATVTADAADQFEGLLHAPVFVLNPCRLQDIPRNVRSVGRLLGLDAGAEDVAAGMEQRLAGVAKAVAGRGRPSVFLEVWHDPLTTAGAGTFLDDLVCVAGGRNIAASLRKPFPTFSLESLLAADPDVYVLTTGMVPSTDPARRPGFGSLRAVRNRRVARVPASPVLRPTPRLAEGAALLARAIHPDAKLDRSSLR